MSRNVYWAHPFLPILMLPCLLSQADSASADSRSFAIHGDIYTDCGFEPANVTFDLGNVETSSMPSVGSASNWAEGAIVSTGCAGVSSVTLAVRGVADADDSRLFAAFGGAQGVAIELATADGRQATPNGPGLTWQPRDAGGIYLYRARYVRTQSDLKIGPATATITVSIEHQ